MGDSFAKFRSGDRVEVKADHRLKRVRAGWQGTVTEVIPALIADGVWVELDMGRKVLFSEGHLKRIDAAVVPGAAPETGTELTRERMAANSRSLNTPWPAEKGDSMKEQEAAYEVAQEYLLVAEEKYEYQKRRMLRNYGVPENTKALEDARRLVARARTEELIARNALVDTLDAEAELVKTPDFSDEPFGREEEA